jgi:hypothetical protein
MAKSVNVQNFDPSISLYHLAIPLVRVRWNNCNQTESPFNELEDNLNEMLLQDLLGIFHSYLQILVYQKCCEGKLLMN